MTKKDYFNMIIAETSNADIIAFCNRELDLLEKKNVSYSKSNVNKIINDIRRNAIIELLSDGSLRTVAEITEELEYRFTNQQTLGLIRPLLADGVLLKFMEGKEAYYTVAV